MKQIIYIGGCGRSGSTILGLTLGNSDRTLDLGEVVDFARFEGKPNGFEAGSANYVFWQRIVSEVASDIGECNWPELKRLTARYDSHAGLMLSLITCGLFPRRCRARYYDYISSLYRRIMNTEGVDVFVDSSKYPGRLYHLAEALGDGSITVVHLVRSPVDVARSLRTTLQSAGKSWLAALTYYFAVNLMMNAVIRRARLKHVVIRYEDFVDKPAETLRIIGQAARIDVESVVSKVMSEAPLERGYMFNGNRMRLLPRITLRRNTNEDAATSTWPERLLVAASDWLFAARGP
jgi:hypothetical protein